MIKRREFLDLGVQGSHAVTSIHQHLFHCMKERGVRTCPIITRVTYRHATSRARTLSADTTTSATSIETSS